MKTYSILFILLFSILSCSLNKTYFVKGEYKNKKIVGKNLAIVLIPPEPIIENRMDIIQEIADGNPVEIYKNFFIENLQKYLKDYSFFKSVKYTNVKEIKKLHKRNLELNNKRELSFMAPNDGDSFKLDSVQADFVLVIQDLLVSRSHTKAGAFPTIGGTILFISSPVQQHGKFLFWDNTKGKIVSYGEFLVERPLSKESIRYITKKILTGSPFKNKVYIKLNMPR